jgi:hypothetical protein
MVLAKRKSGQEVVVEEVYPPSDDIKQNQSYPKIDHKLDRGGTPEPVVDFLQNGRREDVLKIGGHMDKGHNHPDPSNLHKGDHHRKEKQPKNVPFILSTQNCV